MSQRDIAAKLGLKSRSLVSDWEQGRAFPMGNDLILMSVIYGAPVEALYSEYIEELQHQHPKQDLVSFTNQ